MQIALNEFVFQSVANSEVIGLIIKEDYAAIALKMDLKYKGQYRMVKKLKVIILTGLLHSTDMS
ncbi:MAG: hypothetical protein EXX96DRAFT_518455 [Benjaminiella poitrasii]|nr:MAG: hypothetical protein EXX96DRAFT_518455 [Benjaminiella poitrasii]